MTYTANYGFQKPELSEQYRLQHWNDNTDAIDAEIKSKEDRIAETERRLDVYDYNGKGNEVVLTQTMEKGVYQLIFEHEYIDEDCMVELFLDDVNAFKKTSMHIELNRLFVDVVKTIGDLEEEVPILVRVRISHMWHDNPEEVINLKSQIRYSTKITSVSDDAIPLLSAHIRETYPTLPDAVFTQYQTLVANLKHVYWGNLHNRAESIALRDFLQSLSLTEEIERVNLPNGQDVSIVSATVLTGEIVNRLQMISGKTAQEINAGLANLPFKFKSNASLIETDNIRYAFSNISENTIELSFAKTETPKEEEVIQLFDLRITQPVEEANILALALFTMMNGNKSWFECYNDVMVCTRKMPNIERSVVILANLPLERALSIKENLLNLTGVMSAGVYLAGTYQEYVPEEEE